VRGASGRTPPTARPQLHLTARSGWINDPHGVTFHGGRYHAFYQYVPGQPGWRPAISWGHATSPDLLAWTEQPVALAPGDGDDGCFTGAVAVPDDGPAALLYTSVSTDDIELGRIRLAHPADDGWTAWRKDAVLAGPPAGENLVVYRDPCVLRDGDRWRMLVGAGYADGRPAVMCYSSDDPRRWTFDGPLDVCTPDGVERPWSGRAWECPQLVAVGDRHVLVVSVWSGGDPTVPYPVVAAVGSLAGRRFTVDRWQRLTEGPAHFAMSAFTYADGGPRLVSWFRGVGDDAAGWRGALSLPYRISLDGDVAVVQPDGAVAALREDPGSQFHAALDLEWAPHGTADRVAVVRADGVTVATLESGGGTVTLRPATREPITVPLGFEPVRVVVDGPILEGTTGETVFGTPLPPGDARYRVEGAAGRHLSWWALRPPAG
jgi:beta-fructofuranosidase